MSKPEIKISAEETPHICSTVAQWCPSAAVVGAGRLVPCVDLTHIRPVKIFIYVMYEYPESKVHGANMGPHAGPMNLAFKVRI